MGLQNGIIEQVRINVNEPGVSSGQWTDANILKILTEGQLHLISSLHQNQEKRARIEKGYICRTLSPLEKVKSYNLGAGTTDYDIVLTLSVTDFLFNQALELDTANSGTLKPAAFLSNKVLRERKANEYTAPNAKFPAYSITNKTIVIAPSPSASTNGLRWTYIKNPGEVTALVDISLGAECCDALEFYATWKCLGQFRKPIAKQWEEKYFLEIQKLS